MSSTLPKPRLSSYHTNAATMATALRALADQLDSLGNTEFAETDLAVRFQVISRPHSLFTDEERALAADLLAEAIGSNQGCSYQTNGLYTLPLLCCHLDGLDAAVFGAMAPPAAVLAELWDEAHAEYAVRAIGGER